MTTTLPKVFILVPEKGRGKRSAIRRLFDHPDYAAEEIEVTRVPILGEKKEPRVTISDDYEASEAKAFIRALESTPEGRDTLIIDSTSISYASPETIKEVLHDITSNKGWDLFYLTSWLDRCDKYSKVRDLETGQEVKGTVYSTQAPRGLQALMVSESGKGKIFAEKMFFTTGPGKPFFPVTKNIDTYLTETIGNGGLSAQTLSQNLFEASFDDDEYKHNRCIMDRDPLNVDKIGEKVEKPIPSSTEDNTNIYWVVGIAAALVVAYLLLRSKKE